MKNVKETVVVLVLMLLINFETGAIELRSGDNVIINQPIQKLVFASFTIFILIKLFSLTPFVGFPITALMVCMAWGSILLNMKWKRQQATSIST